MSGHTKGPWKARMGEILGADGATVADTRTSPRDDDEVIANAALIASAPGLLAERDALKAALTLARLKLMDMGVSVNGETLTAVNKALGVNS